MRSCESCGSEVSSDYARVFGDNQGQVHACPDCRSQSAVLNGAASDPEREHRVGIESGSKRGEITIMQAVKVILGLGLLLAPGLALMVIA